MSFINKLGGEAEKQRKQTRMGIDEKTMRRPQWQTTNNFTSKKKKMYKAIQYEGSVERRELYPGGDSDL